MKMVTVGFKCTLEMKQMLEEEAEASEMSMSQYLKAICEKRHQSMEEEVFTDETLDEYLEYLEITTDLHPLFEKHRGKTMRASKTGELILVERYQDLVKLLVQAV